MRDAIQIMITLDKLQQYQFVSCNFFSYMDGLLYFQVLEENPDFGINLSQSFSSNHLSMAAATVYRLVLKKIDLTIWKQKFLEPLLSAVISDSSLIRSNNFKQNAKILLVISLSTEITLQDFYKNEKIHLFLSF